MLFAVCIAEDCVGAPSTIERVFACAAADNLTVGRARKRIVGASIAVAKMLVTQGALNLTAVRPDDSGARSGRRGSMSGKDVPTLTGRPASACHILGNVYPAIGRAPAARQDQATRRHLVSRAKRDDQWRWRRTYLRMRTAERARGSPNGCDCSSVRTSVIVLATVCFVLGGTRCAQTARGLRTAEVSRSYSSPSSAYAESRFTLNSADPSSIKSSRKRSLAAA